LGLGVHPDSSVTAWARARLIEATLDDGRPAIVTGLPARGRRLPTRADAQAAEQLVQLVERLGIPARGPGRDGLVQRLPRRIEIVDDEPGPAANAIGSALPVSNVSR
jgi:hypothetical protein